MIESPHPPIHVSIPYVRLINEFMDKVIREQIHLEILLDTEALDNFSKNDFAATARRLHDHGLSITIHGPFMDLCPGSPDPLIRQVTRNRFLQLLDAIPLFGPKSVVCHAAYDPMRYGPIRQFWLETSMATWQWLAKQIRNAGSHLMLENVFEHTPDQIKPLFEQLPDVGFCLDTGHQNAFSKSTMETWVAKLGKYIGQIHFHDNFGNKDDHLAPGMGNVNFTPLFDRLKHHRPLPIITMEAHQQSHLTPGLTYLKSQLFDSKYLRPKI